MKRDTEALRARLQAEPRCRVCRSGESVQVHHVVARSSVQDDSPLNTVPLCFRCHTDFHDHRLDLLGYLTPEEQASAVILTRSIEAARMLLCPSAYRVAA